MSSTIAPLLHQGQPEGEDSDCTVVVRSAAAAWPRVDGLRLVQLRFAVIAYRSLEQKL